MFDNDDNFEIEVEVQKPIEKKEKAKKSDRESSVELEIDIFDDRVLDDTGTLDGDEDPDPDIEQEDAPEEVIVSEEDAEKIAADEAKAQKESDRRRSAAARIRELTKDKRELEAKVLNTENARRQEFGQRLDLGKALIERTITDLGNDYAQAVAAGDANAQREAMVKLSKAQQDLAKVEGLLKEHTIRAQAKPPAVKQQVVEDFDDEDGDEAPEARSPVLTQSQKDWLEGKEELMLNDKYSALPREQRKIILPIRTQILKTMQELASEGFDNKTLAFFDELDLRMEEQFGEDYDTLVNDGPEMLLSKKSVKKTDPSPGEALKPQGAKPKTNSTPNRSPTEKARSVPVTGASSASTPQTPGKSSKVPSFDQLPKEQRRMYDTHYSTRMTKPAYAARMHKLTQQQ